MNLQLAHDNFIQILLNIYQKDEAENIWNIASEKVIGFSLGRSKYLQTTLEEQQILMLKNIQDRLLTNEPIQYIINECWFYDIPFYVDKNVLIPRPETEELTDWIIKENKSLKNISILDVGTGSGCIPIILKRKLSDAKVYSCDISQDAINLAQKNASTHHAEINFLEIDFLDVKNFNSLPDVDILVSNPPYIPENNKSTMQQNVLNYEPHLALFVQENDSLIFYNRIADFGIKKLKDGGKIYVEIHEDLANETAAIFQQKGYEILLKKDMQGKDRMIKAVLA